MANCSYSIGPWAWGDFWDAPAPVVGLIDLRTTAECGQAGGEPGLAFFAFPAGGAPAGYDILGTGDLRELQVTGATQDAWQALTGYRPSGTFLLDLLRDHMLHGIDPALVPTIRSELELWLAGHSCIWSSQFDFASELNAGRPYAQRLRAQLRRELRDVRIDALAGRYGRGVRPHGGGPPEFVTDLQFHRRMVTALCEKYRIPLLEWEVLRPAGWPAGEVPLPHSTTLGPEDFTRADGDTIGNVLSWTEVSGDFDTVSNQVQQQTLSSSPNRTARAESDLASTDHYAQVDVSNYDPDTTLSDAQHGCGAAVRVSSSAHTAYHGYRWASTGGVNGNMRLYKVVSGTGTSLNMTALGSGDGGSCTVKTTANGSTIQVARTGTTIISITDTAITTGTRCGLANLQQASSAYKPYYDNWSAADLAAGATNVIAMIL